MLLSLPIIGASATALTFYLTLHLLTVGAFALPARPLDSRAPIALSCVHPHAQALPCAASAQQQANAAPLSADAVGVVAASARLTQFAPTTAISAIALLTTLSPRAP